MDHPRFPHRQCVLPSRRVELMELRMSIDAGCYEIDSALVADALVRRGGLAPAPLSRSDARNRPRRADRLPRAW